MAEDNNRPCGKPSVPRDTLPSMFQILGWCQEEPKKEQNCDVECKKQEIAVIPLQPQCQIENTEAIVQNASLVRSQYVKESPKRQKAKSMTKSGIYEYKEVHLKRSMSVKHSQTVGSKVVQTKKIEPVKKKLNPHNQDDLREIEERIQRIKKFGYVTRDLPNSSMTTYYGKPAWEAYGRANSNPNLLSHNVMPHRGQNKPKRSQSYYSALLKGKKQNLSNYVPRKPVEEIMTQLQEEKNEDINLPMEYPDLINHVRFTAEPARVSKNQKIPSNKVAPLKVKNAKKNVRKQKKRKQNLLAKTEVDGLKYMNIRQDLLKILQKKKTDSSKLAWKITECYPFDLNNETKLKQSTVEWQNVHIAGVESKKGDSVKELMTLYKKEQK